MPDERELWKFVRDRLCNDERVILLVVGESSGSSPGRAGYKMAVGSDGEIFGSIGGGVMEVNLVEQSRSALAEPGAVATGFKEQVHQKTSPNASGMICSGKQTVIFHSISSKDSATVNSIIEDLNSNTPTFLTITPSQFHVSSDSHEDDIYFERSNKTDFVYHEKLGPKNHLYIIGGGHCALALSELMSRMDFHISICDDRPNLNTIEKNQYADEITILENYEKIGSLNLSGSNIYVVVMTLGYRSDEIVIRNLLDKEFKYFGVLGSRAKMKALLHALEKDGISKERLEKIHTPIGIPINSQSPEEIAISIAAEIISVKNS
jgi:xanthine dehydrogenase accessory factor